MPVISEAATPPVMQPGVTEYAHAGSHAVSALLEDVHEHGVAEVLKLPREEPTPLGLYRRSWVRGAKIDGYSYVAGSIVHELTERMPEPSDECEEKTVRNLSGVYGQLGASILLRCIQKGTDAYIGSTEVPEIEECDAVIRRSFQSVVHPLAALHNSVGSRLEILYELTGRSNDIYTEYAASIPNRYKIGVAHTPEPHLILEDLSYAFADAERYAELEPTIPRIDAGICPLESPRSIVGDPHKQTSLQALWNIAIDACKETPWLWPEQFAARGPISRKTLS